MIILITLELDRKNKFHKGLSFSKRKPYYYSGVPLQSSQESHHSSQDQIPPESNNLFFLEK